MSWTGGGGYGQPQRSYAQVASAVASPQAAPASGGGTGGGPSKWPQSLRNYVERAFEVCDGDRDTSHMEKALKSLIDRSTAAGTLWTTGWDSYPLPSLPGKPAAQQSVWTRIQSGITAASTATSTATPGGWAERGGINYGYSAGNYVAGGGDGYFSEEEDYDDERVWFKNVNMQTGCHRNGTKIKKRKFAKLQKEWKKKMGRGTKRSASQRGSIGDLNDDPAQRRKRAARFGNEFSVGSKSKKGKKGKKGGSASFSHSNPGGLFRDMQKMREGEDMSWGKFTVKGTSMSLEKRYLRLTSPPPPETVRPEHVLRRSLVMVQQRWVADRNYPYVCEQLKSIRQDLTVQRIRNGFTVSVYETHARLALENLDHEEYNQCQTQLQQLYTEGHGGQYVNEFTAYRILYYVHIANFSEIAQLLSTASPDMLADEGVAHALKVRAAVAAENFARLFRLYESAPNMGAYLMDMFVGRFRLKAYRAFMKAYKPKLEVAFLSRVLAFTTEAECREFLAEYQAVFISRTHVDCKASFASCVAKIKADQE